jgi:transposase
MPNRVRILTVPDADRAELERRARSKGAPARVVERARIVLLAADGLTGSQIAERAGCTEPTVVKWRRQYAEAGLAGLEDAPRPGGPKTVLTDEVVCEILAATVTPPPRSLQAAGVTHWSSRRLADWLGQARGIRVSHDSVSVLWRKFCLQPHRVEGFKFSTDPQLEAKIRDVVGLYLDPPEENAVVVCLDEGRQTHDHIRHGTTTLFAALEAATALEATALEATGQVAAAYYPGDRHGEFLRFLKKLAAAYPAQDLHVVCDNYFSHKHAGIRKWLARPENQRIALHFVPASCSWLNLVECFFWVITSQTIGRDTSTSVKQLLAAIGTFIGQWNEHPHLFTWTKDADEILASIHPRED